MTRFKSLRWRGPLVHPEVCASAAKSPEAIATSPLVEASVRLGVRWQAKRDTAFPGASVFKGRKIIRAERVRSPKGGVALRFPPHSKFHRHLARSSNPLLCLSERKLPGRTGPFTLFLGVFVISSAAAGAEAQPRPAEKPQFEPLQFFAGRTVSNGIFESPLGKPRQSFTTSSWGRLDRDTLVLSQSFIYEAGRTQQRVIAGVAKGKRHGYSVSLSYIAALTPGDATSHVHVKQVWQLQPDGTVTNGTTIRKAGKTIARSTERYTRPPLPLGSPSRQAIRRATAKR